MATKRRRSSGGYQPADGQLRRSQVITTYGPGALVDLLNDAVMISGLDHWRARGWDSIREPRLANSLAPTLRSIDVDLDLNDPFRAPPTSASDTPDRGVGIDAVEFPAWFVCQNPECRALVRKNDGLEHKRGRWRHDCTRSGSECVPVRFVSACQSGHIDEFPWTWFVHHGGDPSAEPVTCAAPRLRFNEGPAGDFASIVVECLSCKSRRRLIDARTPEGNPRCRGRRPWLGFAGSDGGTCGEDQRLLVRTASNAYFSVVESALSIPEEADTLHDRVRAHWSILKTATPATLPAFRTIEDVQLAIDGVSDDDVLRVVADVREGRAPASVPIRHAEYAVLTSAQRELPGERPPLRSGEFFARCVDPPDNIAGIGRVVLVHNLREVRAQLGFTRVSPAPSNVQGDRELSTRVQPLSLNAGWLPAVEIRGEGIFIELDLDHLHAWESRPEVLERARQLTAGVDRYQHEVDDNYEFWGVRFYLLHTLAHLLITSLSLECGYSASAIRERIYCAGPGYEHGEMAGILLSTGTPGTDGTLGGLVDQGRRLAEHLELALRNGGLCSNDPVCAHHDPADDSERWLDGAACHGCLYVAESSCEWFNRSLDRALVVPVMGVPAAAAYFQAPGIV